MKERAVIWDFGGVITSSPFDNFKKFKNSTALIDEKFGKISYAKLDLESKLIKKIFQRLRDLSVLVLDTLFQIEMVLMRQYFLKII